MQFDVVFTDEADDTFDSIRNQILKRWVNASFSISGDVFTKL